MSSLVLIGANPSMESEVVSNNHMLSYLADMQCLHNVRTSSGVAVVSLVAVTQLTGQHRASRSSSSSPVLCTVIFDLYYYHALWLAYAAIMVSIMYRYVDIVCHVKKRGTNATRLS
jgi:hypothetical protein